MLTNRINWLRLLSYLVLLLLVSGCVTSRMAANRLVTAPNQQSGQAYHRQTAGFWHAMQTNLFSQRIELPLRFERLSVGPPEAELQIVELPAQNYRLTVSSEFGKTPAGLNTVTVSITTNAASAAPVVSRAATMVLLHGYLLGKEAMLPWAIQLAQAGYRVILVDLRGHGQSTGATVFYGKHEVNDLRQMLDALLARDACDPIIGVLGFSYGATLGLHWAAQDPRVRTVVALAPYDQPEHAFERVAELLKIPVSPRTVQKATAMAAKRLDLNWADWSGTAAIRQVKVPVLLLSGEYDSVSRPDDLIRLRFAAGGLCKLTQLDGADHVSLPMRFSDLHGPITNWLQTHLSPPVGVSK